VKSLLKQLLIWLYGYRLLPAFVVQWLFVIFRLKDA